MITIKLYPDITEHLRKMLRNDEDKIIGFLMDMVVNNFKCRKIVGAKDERCGKKVAHIEFYDFLSNDQEMREIEREISFRCLCDEHYKPEKTKKDRTFHIDLKVNELEMGKLHTYGFGEDEY